MIIIGLTFMSVLIFEFVEKGFLWICMHTCCIRDKKLKDVISKNLDGHRKRNSKTSIMFTLAISFLIFAASSFGLLSGLIEGEVITIFGSDLWIDSPMAASGHYLDESTLSAFIEEQITFDGSIAAYGYISASMADVTGKILSTSYSQSFGDLTGYNLIPIKITAVP